MKYTLIVLGLSLNIAFSQCEDLSESQCNFNFNCNWTSNIVTGNCYNLSVSECLNYDNCYVDSLPGWYDSSGPYCTGGTYQIDNGYCEDNAPLECFEIDYELQCNQESECEWEETITYGNCSNYNNGSSCDANSNCYWDLCYGGYYGSWSHCCRGGTYEIYSGSCEEYEISYIPGDANSDGYLNVSDVVLIVDSILNSQYNEYSDVNQDGVLSVIDIIDLINIILGD